MDVYLIMRFNLLGRRKNWTRLPRARTHARTRKISRWHGTFTTSFSCSLQRNKIVILRRKYMSDKNCVIEILVFKPVFARHFQTGTQGSASRRRGTSFPETKKFRQTNFVVWPDIIFSTRLPSPPPPAAFRICVILVQM